MDKLRLVERDYLILNEIYRWRAVTGKHIAVLAGFPSLRTCDRRLNKLLSADYIVRQKILYGVPSLYSLTSSGKALIGVPDKAEHIRTEQIIHDIAVLNTAIYFNRKYAIAFDDMLTEKQLHKQDGFGIRRHRPDFVFRKNQKMFCVEVELNLKSKGRFEKNIISNFTEYHGQFWVVPDFNSKISTYLVNKKNDYPNIRIIELAEVKKWT